MSFDICHHLDTVTWQTDPFYVKFFDNIPAVVSEYVERLRFLGRPEATPEEASLLAAHAYVRYLGDLSGGQIMKRKIIKAYNMYDDGEGLAFYNFRTLDPRTGDRPAEMHEVRKIKDWFRRGIDEAVVDREAKGTSASHLITTNSDYPRLTALSGTRPKNFCAFSCSYHRGQPCFPLQR